VPGLTSNGAPSSTKRVFAGGGGGGVEAARLYHVYTENINIIIIATTFLDEMPTLL
jgi:hypothetical protein